MKNSRMDNRMMLNHAIAFIVEGKLDFAKSVLCCLFLANTNNAKITKNCDILFDFCEAV